MAVDISPRQLELDRFELDVRLALEESGIEPGLLTLELAEAALGVGLDEKIDRLGELKGLGVRVGVDRFGAGYSSLTYLRKRPGDAVKIDPSFVAQMEHSRVCAALVHALAQLGKVLGIETGAEVVEEPGQRDRRLAEQVDSAQGGLFSRPLRAEAVDELAAEPRQREPPRASPR